MFINTIFGNSILSFCPRLSTKVGGIDLVEGNSLKSNMISDARVGTSTAIT